MLSGESAIGSYGMKALSVLRTTSTRMEQSCREESRQTLLHQRKLGASLPDQIAEQICNCAVEMGTSPFYVLNVYNDLFVFDLNQFPVTYSS